MPWVAWWRCSGTPAPGAGVGIALGTALAVVLAAGATVAVAGLGPAGAAGVRPRTAAGAGDWLVYHHDPSGSGVAGSGVDPASLRAAWTSPALDGQLYGEPLVLGTRVYVATEDDTVYALSARNGSVLWRRHLARPVPAADLPCGDIAPAVGITGTPVIDPARHEIFVVADQIGAGGPAHVLYGLGTTGGRVELRQAVDPSGSSPAALLQRVSLTLDRGAVVLGYGGNYGDCGHYHGWVVAVPEVGGPMREFEVDAGPGESQGAVWMGGAAPVVDGNGDVWVATGNGSVTTPSGPYDHSDSVLELSPSMQLLQSFAPSDWYRLSAEDADLGSAPPALLADGTVLQGGKGHTLYLLRQAKLGGVGGQLDQRSGVCSSGVDGGTAVVGDVAYLPCQSGLLAVRVDPAGTMTLRWRTPTGAGGPPIVADGLVWTIGGRTLYGLSPSTGDAVRQLSVGANADHFPTPSVGDGLLLAPAGDRVVAFGQPVHLGRPGRRGHGESPSAAPRAFRARLGATLGGSPGIFG